MKMRLTCHLESRCHNRVILVLYRRSIITDINIHCYYQATLIGVGGGGILKYLPPQKNFPKIPPQLKYPPEKLRLAMPDIIIAMIDSSVNSNFRLITSMWISLLWVNGNAKSVSVCLIIRFNKTKSFEFSINFRLSVTCIANKFAISSFSWLFWLQSH